MGHLGGIVVAYLAVVVVVAVLAGIPQKVGGGLFRGLRWAIGFLQRDPWLVVGMQLGFLAMFLVTVIWHDNPLPMSVLGPMLFWPWIALTLAGLSGASRLIRWMALGFVAAITVLGIWADNPFPLALGLCIVSALASVSAALWPVRDKKRAGAR
ncbi:MAG TPA: hypothetical protein VFU88_21000 [Ktedonobacterales bacterium]|nr:hypothetical protein [Ktedonobacterales bacterium]